MNGIVYKATNKINGKSYIGITRNALNSRILTHIRNSKKNGVIGFAGAIAKYGIENFEWEILETVDVSMLSQKEIFYIKKYNTYVDNGYNITRGGETIFGASGKYHYLNLMTVTEKQNWLKKHRVGKNNGMYKKGYLVSGENHFTKKYDIKKVNEILDKISGENNYQKKLTTRELKNKCWINKLSKNEKLEWTKNNLVGKNNPFAKKYIITTPDNEEFIVNCQSGLKEFCKNWKKEKLTVYGLNGCVQKRITHYKGYKCQYYNYKADS